MIKLLYVNSDNLRLLSRWNPLALLVAAAVVGALVGWTFFIHMFVAVLVGGLWLIYDGFSRWQQLRLVEDTTTEPVGSVAAGLTEVSGTCEPVGEPIDPVFADDDCVLSYWEVQERDDGWETLVSGGKYTPFVINDGTGLIRIEPTADATVRISERNRTEIETGSTRWASDPEEIRDFLDQRDDIDEPETFLLFRQRRRYIESVLPPGEEAYVLGGASIQDDGTGSEELVLSKHDSTDQFIVSDRAQEEFVDFDRALARKEVGAGATVIVAMLAAYAAGPAKYESTGILFGVALAGGLTVFLYGLWYRDWW